MWPMGLLLYLSGAITRGIQCVNAVFVIKDDKLPNFNKFQIKSIAMMIIMLN